MEEKRPVSARPHQLTARGRRSASVTGVKDVLSFDEQEVMLETELGLLQVKGQERKVKRVALESGEVDMEGQIDSLVYSDAGHYRKSGESFLKRMLK